MSSKRNKTMLKNLFMETAKAYSGSELWKYHVSLKDLPYQLNKEGKFWIVLNREKKPVGFAATTTPFAEYKDYKKSHGVKIDDSLILEHCFDSAGNAIKKVGSTAWLYRSHSRPDNKKDLTKLMAKIDNLFSE